LKGTIKILEFTKTKNPQWGGERERKRERERERERDLVV